MIPRTSVVPRHLVLAALLAVPALAAAQPRGSGFGGSQGPALEGVSLALLAGLDLPSQAGLDVGPRFTGELMYGVADLTPQLRADLGGRLSFAYHNANFGDLWLFDVVPDLRLLVGLTPRLSLYGDLGVGIAVVRFSDNIGSGTHTVATFQLGPGISYALSPKLNLLAEIRFNFYTGGEGTYTALPTLGFQWH
jgi:opacity protein-like surface antigen